MKHKWKPLDILTARCSVCGTFETIRKDPLDVDGIIKERRRILKRNDCEGKK